jgi:hypothetical protein
MSEPKKELHYYLKIEHPELGYNMMTKDLPQS